MTLELRYRVMRWTGRQQDTPEVDSTYDGIILAARRYNDLLAEGGQPYIYDTREDAILT